MIRVPRLRMSGPLSRRDATVLLTVASFLITARIPMGFLALLVLPAVTLLVQGVRRHPWARLPRVLQWLLGTCLATSFVAMAITQPAALVTPASGFMVVVAILLVSLAVFASGNRRRASRRLLDGLYGGLLMGWALSIFEAVTNIKFLPILYPRGNTVASIRTHRLFVSALYPNYNDYSVAMTMLCLLVLARLLFQPRRGGIALGRWLVLLSATFFIVYMGSRGALLALLVGGLALAVVSVRIVRPRAIGVRTVVTTSLFLVVAAVALATSPYVDDHSTQNRATIARNIGDMLQGDPLRALIGWGSLSNYQKAASARYGSILMDPHNLLLEYVVTYGGLALLAYLVCWWHVTRRGVLALRHNDGWQVAGSAVVVALYPVLGIVTSSTLRYHLVWLWIIVALGSLADARGGGGLRPSISESRVRTAGPSAR